MYSANVSLLAVPEIDSITRILSLLSVMASAGSVITGMLFVWRHQSRQGSSAEMGVCTGSRWSLPLTRCPDAILHQSKAAVQLLGPSGVCALDPSSPPSLGLRGVSCCGCRLRFPRERWRSAREHVLGGNKHRYHRHGFCPGCSWSRSVVISGQRVESACQCSCSSTSPPRGESSYTA